MEVGERSVGEERPVRGIMKGTGTKQGSGGGSWEEDLGMGVGER